MNETKNEKRDYLVMAPFIGMDIRGFYETHEIPVYWYSESYRHTDFMTGMDDSTCDYIIELIMQDIEQLDSEVIMCIPFNKKLVQKLADLGILVHCLIPPHDVGADEWMRQKHLNDLDATIADGVFNNYFKVIEEFTNAFSLNPNVYMISTNSVEEFIVNSVYKDSFDIRSERS